MYSCQKEVSGVNQSEKDLATTSGVLPDDPHRVANITLLKSADFSLTAFVSSDGRLNPGGSGRGSKKDTDGDGILDANDACPADKETVNGYLDQDGCPDEVPPPPPSTVPTPTDTDGDGIADTIDKCPTEKETINQFQDDDGCPDTPVVTLPPATIPSNFQLATPPIGNQGNEGACVPFAVAYAARSIEYYYTSNASSYSTGANVFSPEFAYNLTKFGDCGSGTSMTSVLDLLVQQGVCTWQLMPYDDLNGCSLIPDNNQMQNASGYKIASYVKIVNTDRVAIKTMVSSKHPVILTLLADNSFVNARTGFIWKADSGAGVLPHTIIICGYDDSKNAYKVMNSWGTLWGDAGYSWIDYDFFPVKAGYYVYAIQ